ncbi:MAG: hypothetical protein ABIP48_02875 [Planctomycetota bacterium]
MALGDSQRGTLLGLAVGDALGAAVEFQMPGAFELVTGYRCCSMNRNTSMRTNMLCVALALIATYCSAAVRAGEPVNPNLSPAARDVLNYLNSVYQKKVLAGYNVYVHTPDDYEQTGKQAAIWGRDIRWLGDAQEIAQHAKRHRVIARPPRDK